MAYSAYLLTMNTKWKTRYAVGMNKTTLGSEISYKTKMNQDVECNWPGGIFGPKKGKKATRMGKEKKRDKQA